MKMALCSLFLFVFFSFSFGLRAQSLVIGPYLQNVTDRSVVVRFELDAPSEVQIQYGPTDAYGSSVSAPASTVFEFALDGLIAGEFYHYRLLAGTTPLCEDTLFRAAPPARVPFRLLAMGDTRSDHDTHGDVIAAASATDPHVWVHTGDMVSDGEEENQWYTFFEIETLLMKSVPQFGVIGNHDEYDGRADIYAGFYTLPENSYSPEHYYSFDYGNLHGIVLDGHVNVDPEWQCVLRIGSWESCFNDEQMAWLTDDLAAAAGNTNIDHIFVFVHIGPYSSKEGRTGSKQMRDLLPMFLDHGVEMIISGHDHYYERGFSDNGIAYIITAGGGAPLYATYVPPIIPPHSVIYNETVYHYTVIDIDWLCIAMTAYRLDGSVLDSFSYCSEPRVCVNPDTDCGMLPPSCAGGRWVCEAGYCETRDCEGFEPLPDDVVEPAPETVEEDESESGFEPAADDTMPEAADTTLDTQVPDGEGDAEAEGEQEEGQTGCSCEIISR